MENKEENKDTLKKVAIGIGIFFAVILLMGNCNGGMLPSCNRPRQTNVVVHRHSHAKSRSWNIRIPKPHIFRSRGRR